MLWSIKKPETKWIGNFAPDIDTYGYGLSTEYVQLIEDSSKVKFSFKINLEEGFVKRNLTLGKRTYSLKILIENYYLNAKVKTYPMWFGKLESNTRKIVIQ